MKKRIISVLIVLAMFTGVFAAATSAQDATYTIKNPYEDVIWSGEGTYTAYKGNLHTHSTVSDADSDMRSMILGAYEQGFDFLAFTEHGVTGKAWNEKPVQRVLYTYQTIIGNKFTYLTDEEFAAVSDGSYPVNDTARGKGMFCVTGGNELNAVTLTKSHVNGLFLPENVGNANIGFENGFEYAVNLADKNGGVSFINHPGDWLESEYDISAVYDKDTVNYFADILLRYDTCLGMEIFNGSNSLTPYDRNLWDNLLMAVAPYGKTCIGFSNSDAHDERMLNSSFSVFMMPECSMENIRSTMSSGAFFAITRRLYENPVIGPETGFDNISEAPYTEYPMVNNVSVNGHTVTLGVTDAQYVNFIGDGKIIATVPISESGQSVSLDLDSIKDAQNLSYVRAEIYGSTSVCATQAFMLDDGLEKPEYVRDESCSAVAKRVENAMLSTRMFVILQELFRLIKDKLADAFGN